MANALTPIHPAQLKRGLIVWLDDCPPLDDDQAKRRPIVVITPTVLQADPNDPPAAVVVACSTTYGPDVPAAILMPNRSTEPQTTTGLPQVCWAVPRWFFEITHADLLRCTYSGTLGGRKLKQLILNYLARRDGTVSG